VVTGMCISFHLSDLVITYGAVRNTSKLYICGEFIIYKGL